MYGQQWENVDSPHNPSTPNHLPQQNQFTHTEAQLVGVGGDRGTGRGQTRWQGGAGCGVG